MPRVSFNSDALPSELPARVRAKMWADSMQATGSAFEMGIVATRKFRGEMTVLVLGRVQVGAATTVADGAVSVARTEAAISRDHDNRIMLVVNRGQSPMHVRQFGREAVLKQDEMSVVAMDNPAECTTPRSGSSNIVMIPREMIDKAGAMLERHSATKLAGDAAARRLLSAHLRELLDCDEPLDAATENAAGDYIADLVNAIVRPVGAPKKSNGDAEIDSRLAAVRKQIGKSFRDPNLAPGAVGKPLGLSARSIQHLLKQNGTTFTAEVTALRLEAAYGMLKSGAKAPIAEIAFKCGFADLSTFYRAFRARYGETPNALRANGK